MTTEENITEKLCVDCAQSIPTAAPKCGKCGSYQDWRRHVAITQGALSLPISILALITAIILTGQQASNHFKSAASPDTRLQFGIAKIDAQKASLVVTNPTTHPTIINTLSCTIWVPLGREWIERSEHGGVLDAWPTKEESIGVFLVSYRPSEPVMLESGAQKALIVGVDHIAPPRAHGEATGPAPAGCLLGATNDRNELVAAGAMLNPSNLLSFDAFKMVDAADYSKSQQGQLKSDKRRIASYRK